MVDFQSPRPVPSAARWAARRRRVEGGRPIAIKVRLSDDEYAMVKACAEDAKVSIQRFLVARALPQGAQTGQVQDVQRASSQLTAELAGLRRLVANLANNVNQIARKLNSGGVPDSGIPVVMHTVRRAMLRLDAALAASGPERLSGFTPPQSAGPRISGPPPGPYSGRSP